MPRAKDAKDATTSRDKARSENVTTYAKIRSLFRDFITGVRTFDEPRSQKVRAFYSHTTLDHWAPHFTLLNPYSGPNADGIASALARLTAEFQEFTVDTICLLVQERDGDDWFIYREFFRN